MKILSVSAILVLMACNSHTEDKNMPATVSSSGIEKVSVSKEDTVSNNKEDIVSNKNELKEDIKVYGNDRFRRVTIANIGQNNYMVKGEAQVFEAAFSWVIINGKKEIQKGHVMSDAGAPAWGKFEFQLKVNSTDPASNLHLLLFESSPKDGSRQHQLSIPLEV